MSYCRFSSDNWKSDVYVYESDHFIIHVAGRRRVGVEDLPPDPLTMVGEISHEEWKVAYDKHREQLEGLELVDIDLPYAGETLPCASAADCASRLKELRDLGYHVPEHAIIAVEKEAETEVQP